MVFHHYSSAPVEEVLRGCNCNACLEHAISLSLVRSTKCRSFETEAFPCTVMQCRTLHGGNTRDNTDSLVTVDHVTGSDWIHHYRLHVSVKHPSVYNRGRLRQGPLPADLCNIKLRVCRSTTVFVAILVSWPVASNHLPFKPRQTAILEHQKWIL